MVPMTGLSDKPFQDDLFASETGQTGDARATSFASGPRQIGGNDPALATQTPPTMEEMAQRLEDSGNYRVLRKLQPRPIRQRTVSETHKIGVILDTETTGLDPRKDEIIELGMIAFTYDENGIADVVDVFSALREPSVPISAEITRITGITAQMVEGQRIDIDAVGRFIDPADLVIAHNARFDRPFCERFSPGFDVKPWVCSVSEIDWTRLGYEGTKLSYLIGQSGYFHNGHRAVDDCHALLEVLAARSRTDAEGPFDQLLVSSAQTRLRLYAIGSPFDMKDILKARGYRWSDGSDGAPKSWWCEIAEEAYEEELWFLRDEIYRADVEPHVQRMTSCERFKM